MTKPSPSAYSATAQFYSQKAEEFKATLKGELRQSSSSLLTVFPDDNALFGAPVYALVKQYPLPSDRIDAGTRRVSSLLAGASKGKYGDKESHTLLDIDCKASVNVLNAEAKRTVITSLVTDIERFERLAKEWTERDRKQQEAEDKRQQKLMVAEPIATLQSLLPKLREQSDLIVVLRQCGISTDRNIGRIFPNVVVIGGVGATVLKVPEKIENSWILPTSAQGADVCEVRIEVRTNEKSGDPKIEAKDFKRHPVIGGVPEDPRIREILEDYFAALAHQAQRTVRQMPAGRRFVGSHRCAERHKEDGKIGKESKHAHAIETLKSQMGMLSGHGQKFPANRINECYLCHRVSPPEGMAESCADNQFIGP